MFVGCVLWRPNNYQKMGNQWVVIWKLKKLVHFFIPKFTKVFIRTPYMFVVLVLFVIHGRFNMYTLSLTSKLPRIVGWKFVNKILAGPAQTLTKTLSLSLSLSLSLVQWILKHVPRIKWQITTTSMFLAIG